MPRSNRWAHRVLAGALASLAACHDGGSHPDVYVAGRDGPAGNATVWKNGVAQTLGEPGSAAHAVAVSGDDVYVAGCEMHLGATVWRNGAARALGAIGGCAVAIAVAGTDVYVVGYDIVGGAQQPMLWTNGVGQILPHDPRGSASASAVAVSGADVYVAGWRFEFNTANIATLWKNGVALALSDGVTPALAFGVALDGGDVYAVGTVADHSVPGGTVATLWKNGLAQALGSGSAYGVAVANGVVHVTGSTPGTHGDVAVSWDGGGSRTLADDAAISNGWGISASPSGVYVVGNDGPFAILWHDGVPLRLTDGSTQATATGVAVVER